MSIHRRKGNVLHHPLRNLQSQAAVLDSNGDVVAVTKPELAPMLAAAPEVAPLQAFERYVRNIVDSREAAGGPEAKQPWVEALRAGLSRLDTDREEQEGNS